MMLLSWGDRGYGDELFFGALVTLEVAVASYLIALVLGTAIAMATLRRKGVAWRLSRIYASAVMGVPPLLVAFILYFSGADLIAGLLGLVGLDVKLSMTPRSAGITALSLVYGAYLADLIRSSILAVPRGQFEAAAMLLVPWRQTWTRIVFPQAIRLALPGLTNIWAIILKDTALISLIGLKEVIAEAKLAAGVTKEPFLFYFAAAAFFLAVSVLTVWLAGRIGARGAGAPRIEAPTVTAAVPSPGGPNAL
jgi:His/Glu/Gln/Arg/opine family amino acid ABC transporter permease subunit